MKHRKSVDEFDLSLEGRKPIKPRNHSQGLYWTALQTAPMVFGVGPAGTGKTFLAAAYAIGELVAKRIDRIILTRATIPIDGEEIGFLPGTLEKKMEPWTAEIFDVFRERVGAHRVVELLKAQKILIIPFAMMRGRTFKNALIIADELQNASPAQAKALVTRIGEGSRMFINGDPTQRDIKGRSGLDDLTSMVDQFGLGFPVVRFTDREVVRSAVCRKWVDAYQQKEKAPN